MADVTINIAGLQVAFSVADADANRILAAHTAIYTRSDVDEQGQPVQVVPTPPEVVQYIAQNVVNELAARTVRFEQHLAEATAREGVPDIEATLATL